MTHSMIPIGRTLAALALTGAGVGAVPIRNTHADALSVPALVARADAALRTARAVAIDTIPPLPGAPRQVGMVSVHAIIVRAHGAWAVDERHTDAGGRTIAETLTTPTRVCRRLEGVTPAAWQCDAGLHATDPAHLPGDAATVWRPLGPRTLFGVAAHGYDAILPSAAGSVARGQYWIDPATGRPVVAQATLAATGAGAAGTTAIVQAERFSRWDDPALARLIPTVPAAPAVPGVPRVPPTARVTPPPTVAPPAPLTVSMVPGTVRGALEVTSGRRATVTVAGAWPHAYCGLKMFYASGHQWDGAFGFIGSARVDGHGVASWAWTVPRVPRAEITTAVARCGTATPGRMAEGHLSFTVVPPGWRWQ